MVLLIRRLDMCKQLSNDMHSFSHLDSQPRIPMLQCTFSSLSLYKGTDGFSLIDLTNYNAAILLTCRKLFFSFYSICFLQDEALSPVSWHSQPSPLSVFSDSSGFAEVLTERKPSKRTNPTKGK